MISDDNVWKRCSECKKPINFGSRYYVCSVSTCNRPRTGLQFCSVSCWEPHVSIMRHRDAGAYEELAPSREAWVKMQKSAMEEKLEWQSLELVGSHPQMPWVPLNGEKFRNIF